MDRCNTIGFDSVIGDIRLPHQSSEDNTSATILYSCLLLCRKVESPTFCISLYRVGTLARALMWWQVLYQCKPKPPSCLPVCRALPEGHTVTGDFPFLFPILIWNNLHCVPWSRLLNFFLRSAISGGWSPKRWQADKCLTCGIIKETSGFSCQVGSSQGNAPRDSCDRDVIVIIIDNSQSSCGWGALANSRLTQAKFTWCSLYCLSSVITCFWCCKSLNRWIDSSKRLLFLSFLNHACAEICFDHQATDKTASHTTGKQGELVFLRTDGGRQQEKRQTAPQGWRS